MCATADSINARIRALFLRRRPLTLAERREYEQLLAEWTAAHRRERLVQADVLEVA